jgi:hypothetical protein
VRGWIFTGFAADVDVSPLVFDHSAAQHGYPDPVRRDQRLCLTTVAALATLSACSLSSTSTPAALPGRHLTRTEFNSGSFGGATFIWPVVADSGTLSCVEVRQNDQRDFAVVFTTDDGTQYALNGSAEHTGRYHPGVEIYVPDALTSNPHPNPTVMIGYGLRLCPHYRPGE